MENKLTIGNIIGWIYGIAVFAVGVLNVVLVHPVPGTIYLLLSLVYLPPVNVFIEKRFSFPIPVIAKIILGIVIFFFTLGVSDLAEMFGI